MWAEVNGERKKVACGPCIRGHRSSKCDHRDRVLVEVRKPGRPLSSCPHPSGSCSCERIVINYTIPKSSECPSESAQHTATVSGNSRIQKNRRRSTMFSTPSLEKAVRAGQDAETEASSITRTPTERSGSDEASPFSSASSTPRLLPGVSSCCKPQPPQSLVQQGDCCTSKVEQLSEPVQVQPCCSGPEHQADINPNGLPVVYQHFSQPAQFQMPPQLQAPQYPNFHSTASPPPRTTLPFGLGAPIYNHAAAAYQRPGSIPTNLVMGGPIASHPANPQTTQHVAEHNCHCGDLCNCFGCAAHPNNATMIDYVRSMTQFQYTGGFGSMPPPLYDMPTQPQQPRFGAEAFNSMPRNMSSSAPTNMDMSGLSGAPVPISGPWQHLAVSAPILPESPYLEPSNYTTSAPRKSQLPYTKEESTPSPVADNTSEGKEDILSPSSYFWNQMVMPSCSDATGTCQCGDGCACVGCLTHGGHNGVQFEAPTPSGHDTFGNFVADSGMMLDDSPSVYTWSTAPV